MKKELLIELGTVIAATPEKKVDLMYYTNRNTDSEAACGTIFCAWGWAVEHPPFQSMGLGWNRHGYIPHYQEEYGLFAAAKFFEITYDQAGDLFSIRNESRYDSPSTEGISDKELFAHRLECFLKDYT